MPESPRPTANAKPVQRSTLKESRLPVTVLWSSRNQPSSPQDSDPAARAGLSDDSSSGGSEALRRRRGVSVSD